MSLRIIRKLARGERGQIITLGVLGCILVAIMMLLTLNVGQALYEKIRIQQVADSASFSMATQEARSFNFYAYTNRANIGSLVAASSTHSYMTLATTVPELFQSAAINFAVMGVFELARCNFVCLLCIHCYHAAVDFMISGNYAREATDLASEVKKVDQKFQKLISKLDGHMEDIARAQKLMKEFVTQQIRSDTILANLAHNEGFAPQCSLNQGQITQTNAGYYTGSFEGDRDKRKWVPTEVANGTRHKPMVSLRFQFGNDFGVLSDFIKPKTFKKFKKDIPKPAKNKQGKSEVIVHGGSSRVIKDGDKPRSGCLNRDHGPEGDAVGSFEIGFVHSEGFCDQWFTMYRVDLGSNDKKTTHKGSPMGEGQIHQGKHDNFKCLGKGECFTLFKAVPRWDEDWGQPKVYTLIKQDLRKMEGGGVGPWEVSESGKVAMDLGGDVGKRQVQIADPNEAWAMSKALVYYHWPKYDKGAGWKEHPNFFNPYWKAKLQPYRYQEAFFRLRDAGADQYTGQVVPGLPLP